MPNVNRPRVAAIGLDTHQLESLVPLCPDLRPASSLRQYLKRFSMTETDVLVSGAFDQARIWGGAHLLTVGPTNFQWYSRDPSLVIPQRVGPRSRHINTGTTNTEREVSVADACTEVYRALATELVGSLRNAASPPTIVHSRATSDHGETALIETTSSHAVALRLVLPQNKEIEHGDRPNPLALILPEVANLAVWFRAFLADIHEIDPDRVPLKPPRLSRPSDWYTLEERDLVPSQLNYEKDIVGAVCHEHPGWKSASRWRHEPYCVPL